MICEFEVFNPRLIEVLVFIIIVCCCYIDSGSNSGFRDVFSGFSCLKLWDFWVSAILIAIRLKVDRDQDEQIPDLDEG